MFFRKYLKCLLGKAFRVCEWICFWKKRSRMVTVNLFSTTNRSGHAFFSYTNIKALVENTKDIKTNDGYSHYNGTGNGIYFTLSKRIYPVQMYKHRLDKRMEKFNQLKG